MSDDGTLARNAPEEQTRPVASPPTPVRGMFEDPVVRWMGYVAIGVVILFLATILGAMMTGVKKPDGPRTVAERDLLVAASVVKTGKGTGGEWAPYIDALVNNGETGKARAALDTARASVKTTTAPELELAGARVEYAQKRYPQAVKAAEVAIRAFRARFDTRLAAGGETAQRTREIGIESGYYEAMLVKAAAHVQLRDWKNAVATYDGYLRVNSTAADILIDRGNAKASMKDKAGAEKDFREALRYGPDNEEALAGLKRIGAAK